MAKPGRASQEKRGREKAKKEKRQEKIDRRNQRKTDKEDRDPLLEGTDPDLIGIFPGPQPPQEY